MLCLDKRIIGGLAVVALGVLVFAPSLFAAALPVLLVAVCPLSMLLMRRSGGEACAMDDDARGDVDEQIDELRDEAEFLRAQLAERAERPPAEREAR